MVLLNLSNQVLQLLFLPEIKLLLRDKGVEVLGGEVVEGVLVVEVSPLREVESAAHH